MKRSILFVGIICLLACGGDHINRPNISDIEADVSVVRYDQLLFQESNDTSNLKEMVREYSFFSDVFLQQVLNPVQGASMAQTARLFAIDTLSRELNQEVQKRFADFATQKDQLEVALAYYRYYLPEEPLPTIYTCISNFEVGSFTIGPEVMGIGLDFYLGPDYPYDPRLFPEYISATMTEEHLVAKSMQALIEQRIPPTSGVRFIDQMIRNGKVLYLKEKVLPDLDLTIIHEFSSDQLEWVEGNESEIWAFIIRENLLYETNQRKFRKMISPSPNVPGMPEEAPGRVGNWVGYRIVKAYCERNDLTPTELLAEEDVQIIMAGSKYKPRR